MAEETALPEELDPAHYIERVSLVTGEVLDEPILPRQLLVRYHRDYHVVDISARHMMSRMMRATGDAEATRRKMKERRRLGHRAASVIAKAIGQKDVTKISKALFGLKNREYYFHYKKPYLAKEEVEDRLTALKHEAVERWQAVGNDGSPGIRVLLTGGTGFVGKEIIWQAAHDDDIEEMIVVIRPKEIRDRKTKELIETRSPAQRGEVLLDRLWLDTPDLRSKFRFVGGDVEQPDLGLEPSVIENLETRLTHVIHCAASVAFDDPYEKSFHANVTGTLNALRFSHRLQSAPDSPFVAHLGIETSYIHGRQVRGTAREDEIVFPRNFYNNYYELTKAMASIETERFMLAKDLRVIQLCPAIVIGESRAGNNRGDTKVVNAPVNLFGRAQEALGSTTGSWVDRSKGSMLARMACVFPGDPSAEINMIPVDRVVAGIVAALKKPAAVGERVHLATDNRLTSEQMIRAVEEELGIRVKLAEPTLHRTVTLPSMTRLLKRMKQEKISRALNTLGTIFGGYSEWGQPIHEVGNDVRLLGLSETRPNTQHAFRMLCRHNKYVQNFGKLWDLDEISRREKVWWEFIEDLEKLAGRPAGGMAAVEFRDALRIGLDVTKFERKGGGEKGLEGPPTQVARIE
jgi:nucleoside-diphosphate-sugar epimerase